MMHHVLLLYFAVMTIASPFPHNDVLLGNSDTDTAGTVPDIISQLPYETTDNLGTDTTEDILIAANNPETSEYDGLQTDGPKIVPETDATSDMLLAGGNSEYERVQEVIKQLNQRRKELNREIDALVRGPVKKRPGGRKSQAGTEVQQQNEGSPQDTANDRHNFQQQAAKIGSQIGANFQQLLIATKKYHPANNTPSLSKTDIQNLVQNLASQGNQQLSNLNLDVLIASAVAIAPAIGITLRNTLLTDAIIDALPEIVSGLAIALLL